jgi:5-(carboxyamino)imidazole ribonucleotide synthase
MTEPQRLAPLAPGARVGIIGGGQLGRMLAMAAARLGLSCHVYTDRADDPATEVAAAATIAGYGDKEALGRFVADVDVVTYEFENIPAATAEYLNAVRPVRPSPGVLALTQDRLVEKNFISGLGIEVAPYAQVDDPGALARAVAQVGRPSILKTRRFGYDGKGQSLIREGSDIAVAFRSLGGQPAILEGFVPFVCEVSVVAARGIDGDFVAWDIGRNTHEHHILATTTVPADIGPDLTARAFDKARKIADALDYVGVLAVEMFLVEGPGGRRLLVNEIAPRVHNSGHWTLDGSVTSQFEQHLRAICGFPLGSARAHGPVEMRNLIGGDILRWRELLAQPGACLHLYGKSEARPGRKMGHVTFLRSVKD